MTLSLQIALLLKKLHLHVDMTGRVIGATGGTTIVRGATGGTVVRGVTGGTVVRGATGGTVVRGVTIIGVSKGKITGGRGILDTIEREPDMTVMIIGGRGVIRVCNCYCPVYVICLINQSTSHFL